MKKLLTLALMLVMVIALVSCSLIPENIKNIFGGESQGEGSENNGTGEQGGNDQGENDQGEGEGDEEPPHTHEFVLTEDSIAVTCEKDGLNKYACACGETKPDEVVPATGHDMQPNGSMAASCTQKGINYFKCANCGKSKSEIVAALGHQFGEAPEASRFACCTREGCLTGAFVTESNGTYAEQLTFNFDEEDEADLAAKYEEILAIIEAAPEYDPALHGYAEEGALADEYAAVDAIHTEYYELIMYAIAQRQIAEIDYYCQMDNAELEERYSYMMDYYTQLIATFYSLSQPIYDSCYREFFYYGMTEPEIKAYLFDSSAVSDPEYVELKARNSEIELEFFAISNHINDSRVPELYAEFVRNNNRIAEIMGYANYLEYAYGNVYGRDYTYTDVAEITDYIKEYIAPAFIDVYIEYTKFIQNGSYNKNIYGSIVDNSFFKDKTGNTALNDYIDIMAFTSNPDKQISFSDEFNKLMSNGNLYRGQYSGAFVTYLSAFDLPIAYFSGGYDNTFTVAHEFGHYMNEVYNRSEYNQSYDILEVHSQGNEMLYLAFLDGKIDGSAYQMIKIEQIVNTLNVIMLGTAVDCFEQAIYLNSYDGVGADTIMADGQITADEYDYLYYCITEDLGVRGFISETYWRYGMTITSPCYYISYAVSALPALQIYEMAVTDGFEVAQQAYLKLFTYTDINPDFNSEEILINAGMNSYNDEELYKSLYEFFVNN